MREIADPRLIAFCGSETRVSTLGVLANSSGPMTGYRVSRIARLQPIKVYRELARAVESGLVEKTARGYRLLDPDVRSLLQKRVRVSWFESWFADEGNRARRARKARASSTRWFEPERYRANPSVAARYAAEIERPLEKDAYGGKEGSLPSRKLRRMRHD